MRWRASISSAATMSCVNFWTILPLGKVPIALKACIERAHRPFSFKRTVWPRGAMIEDWWIGRFAMRRATLLLCLLLLAPVAGAWPLPEFPTGDGEWVVVRDEGWTHDEWVALREDGLEPLRQISATEVLVWGNHGTYQTATESVLRGVVADGYRVVLEPRLPSTAQWEILSMFEFEALQLAGVGSALPTSVSYTHLTLPTNREV